MAAEGNGGPRVGQETVGDQRRLARSGSRPGTLTALPSRSSDVWADWDQTAAEWDQTAEQWAGRAMPLWRVHLEAVNARLVERWLPPGNGEVLKTDLFDELVGQGLYPLLRERAERVVGVDISPVTVEGVRDKYQEFETVVGDVRELPFATASFDAVVSNSTLDHFHSRASISASLDELWRVLRPGGTLLITLDNRTNPVIAIRNALPFDLLKRLGLVPYYMGVTCGRRRLVRLISAAGFEVAETDVVGHFPRLAAVLLDRRRDPRVTGLNGRELRRLMRFERMARWPTRSLTGYFAAALAVKR